MARYLIHAATIQRDASALSGDLASWTTAEVARLGGCLTSFDYTIGETNLVLMAEMADEAALAMFSAGAAEAGKLRVVGVNALIAPQSAARVPAEPGAIVAPSAVPANVIRFPIAAPEREEPIDSAVAETDPEPVGVASTVAEAETFVPASLAEVAMPPGSYELTVGRFTRFSELGAFTETLHALPGVRSVTTKQFIRGMVSLHVAYDSPIPLTTRLRDMRQFKPEVRETSPAHLEMLVFAESRGEALPAPAADPMPAAAPPVAVAATPTPRAERAASASPSPRSSLLHPVDVDSASGRTAVSPKRLVLVGGLAAAIAATVGGALSA